MLKYSNLVVGVLLLALILLSISVGPFLTPYDPIEPDWAAVSTGPNMEHLLGTDEFGRDVLTRVLYGGRITFLAAFIAQILNTAIGVFLGLLGAYFGGKIDDLINGMVNLLLALPPLILGIAILVVLGSSTLNVILVVGITYWSYTCRLTRSRVLSIKEGGYVESALAVGVPSSRILWRHILPNCLGPILVIATLGLADTILLLATFGFLGLGVTPPTPEWGTMLSEGRNYLYSAPWVTIAPGFAIFTTVLAVNLLGDGLRDIMDPYLKR
ncbi:MAG: ABC transporter permease [Desulfohalobiaceae bacterium]|nr:ABC transporter permease [Desulfohalobiaceae bacterium]